MHGITSTHFQFSKYSAVIIFTQLTFPKRAFAMSILSTVIKFSRNFVAFFFFFFCSSFLFVSLLFFLSFCFAIFVSLFVRWLVVFCFAFWYFPYWNCKWTLFQFQLKKATIVWFSEGLTGFSFKTQLFTLEDNCRFKKRSNGNSSFLLIWFFRVNFRGHKRHYFPREIFWF